MLTCSIAYAHEARTWTLESGESFEGKLIKLRKKYVTLRRSDSSKLVHILRTNVSIADRIYLAETLYRPIMVTVELQPEYGMSPPLYMATDGKPAPRKGPNSLAFRYREMRPSADRTWHDGSMHWVLFTWELGQRLDGTEFRDMKQTTDGTFILVAFRTENRGKREMEVQLPTIVDAKKRRFGVIDDLRSFIPAVLAQKYENPRWARIGARFTRHYCAIYEVPDDARSLHLDVSSLETFSYRGVYLPMGSRAIPLDSLGLE